MAKIKWYIRGLPLCARLLAEFAGEMFGAWPGDSFPRAQLQRDITAYHRQRP